MFVISLAFKLNFRSLRGRFAFNKNIENFYQFWWIPETPFDRFVICNLSVYLLGVVFANPCFYSAPLSMKKEGSHSGLVEIFMYKGI